MAYDDLEPPGDKTERMFGAIMAAIYNSSGNFKRSFKVSDFIPERERMFMTKKERLAIARDKLRAVFGKRD